MEKISFLNQKEMLKQFEKFAKDTGVKSFRANGRSYTLSDDGTEIKCINGFSAEEVDPVLFFNDLYDCVRDLATKLGFNCSCVMKPSSQEVEFFSLIIRMDNRPQCGLNKIGETPRKGNSNEI